MGKKRRGHYCKVCSKVLPNEKFSGKGHSNHVCKKCSKKSPEERREQIKINEIYNMTRFMNLSRNNKQKLQKYLKDNSQKVREAAKSVLDEYTERYNLIKKYEDEAERMYDKMEQEYLKEINDQKNEEDDEEFDDFDIPF